jgi:mono/diheme cytochrome c family protein
LVGSAIVALEGAVVNQILMGAEEHGMPPFARLSDHDIASVATFVRNSWGNDFGPIQPTRVAEIRAYATPEE